MSDAMREIVLGVLATIAPEADLATLDGGADLRDELDIDSLDVLNFAVGIEERTGVEIPEADYSRISTLDACVAYLEQRARTARQGEDHPQE